MESRSLLRVFFICTILCQAAQSAPLLTYVLKINDCKIRVELADNPKSRQQGLMFRHSLPKDSGMLFVYETEHRATMWMKNTSIPLSVAFIDSSGTIVNIEKMKPMDLSHHKAVSEVKYALEANFGWFEDNGIQPGARVNGLSIFNR